MTGMNYSVLEVRRPSKEAGKITQAKEDGSLNQDRNVALVTGSEPRDFER